MAEKRQCGADVGSGRTAPGSCICRLLGANDTDATPIISSHDAIKNSRVFTDAAQSTGWSRPVRHISKRRVGWAVPESFS